MKKSIITLALVCITSFATTANTLDDHDKAQIKTQQQAVQVQNAHENAVINEGKAVAKQSATSGEFDAYYKTPVEGACGEGVCIEGKQEAKTSTPVSISAEDLEAAKQSATSGEFDANYKTPVEGACGEGICIEK